MAGAVGAAMVAIWFLFVDLSQGQLMRTPTMIAQMLFGTGSSDAGGLGIIAVVTVVHFIGFMAVASVLTLLVHAVARNRQFRMALLFASAMAFVYFVGLAYALNLSQGNVVPGWAAIGGGLVGAGSIGAFLWKSHPALASSFSDRPRDDLDSVPHAPER